MEQHEQMVDPTGAAMPFKEDSEFYKALMQQFDINPKDKKKLDFITQLTERDVINFSRVEILHEWSDKKVKMLPLFIAKIMSLRVSQNRQGRREFFETFKPLGFGQVQQDDGFMGRMFRPQR